MLLCTVLPANLPSCNLQPASRKQRDSFKCFLSPLCIAMNAQNNLSAAASYFLRLWMVGNIVLRWCKVFRLASVVYVCGHGTVVRHNSVVKLRPTETNSASSILAFEAMKEDSRWAAGSECAVQDRSEKDCPGKGQKNLHSPPLEIPSDGKCQGGYRTLRHGCIRIQASNGDFPGLSTQARRWAEPGCAWSRTWIWVEFPEHCVVRSRSGFDESGQAARAVTGCSCACNRSKRQATSTDEARVTSSRWLCTFARYCRMECRRGRHSLQPVHDVGVMCA